MPPTAEPIYYYVVRRQGLDPEGPYTAAELASLLRHGLVDDESRYCHAGDQVWLPVDAELRAELGLGGRKLLWLLLLACVAILVAALVFLWGRSNPSGAPLPPPPGVEPSATPQPTAPPLATATPAPATPKPRPTPAVPATPYFSAVRSLVGTIQIYDHPDHVAYTLNGCIVSADGWFATGPIDLLAGYHFVITLADGSTHQPDAVLYSPEHGSATLLKLSGTFGSAAVRPAGVPLEVGEKLTALARSTEGALLVLPGDVVTLPPVPGEDFPRLSVPLSPALSGAPVVDAQGRLLGLGTVRLMDQEWFSVLITLADIDAILHSPRYCQLSWNDYLALLKERSETQKRVVDLIRSGPSDEAARQTAIAEALTRFPDDFELFQKFTLSYSFTQDRAGYEKLVQRWKAAHPDDYRLIVDRAIMLDLTQDKTDQAPLYRQIVAAVPEDGHFWAKLAEALRKSGQNPLEAKDAERLDHALSSNDPADLLSCGWIALDGQNYPLAIACLGRAGDLGYGTPQVWKQLFTAYSRNKQDAAAAIIADRYLRLAPGDPDMWEQAALAWSRAGRFDRADQCLDAALALQPGQARKYETTREVIRARRQQAAQPSPAR